MLYMYIYNMVFRFVWFRLGSYVLYVYTYIYTLYHSTLYDCTHVYVISQHTLVTYILYVNGKIKPKGK